MSQLNFFAILGECSCGGEDSIELRDSSTSRWSTRAITKGMVECSLCNAMWDNISQLCSSPDCRHVVPIYIEALQNEVRLPLTRRQTDVPCARVINDTLYRALALLFDLTRQETTNVLKGNGISIVDTNRTKGRIRF